SAAAPTSTAAASAAAIQRRANQSTGCSDRALSRQSARSGSGGLDLSARNRGGGPLGIVQSERDRNGAGRRHAAAELGSQRQGAVRGPASAGNDEREDRMDAAARRRLSRAA